MATKYTLFYKRTLSARFSQRIYQPIYTLTRALTFKVTRQNPELIPPAKPTPHEFKPLSDFDNYEGLRFQVPIIQFYRKNPSVEADPVEVIRKAIAKALVSYYPFAGRLREHAARKLAVECTGEGVMFIEADADVALEQFGDELKPPVPCLEELLYDVPGSGGIINAPLLLIQVTRLKCGGFIFSLRFNHTMSDGAGIAQFVSAVGELARGAGFPSTPPVWERHLLNMSCTHHEHKDIPDIIKTLTTLNKVVHRSFSFGTNQISALRSHLPPHLRHCTTTFEIVTACLWRCRTIALSLHPDEEVGILWAMDSRRRFNPPIPDGYYGNCCIYPTATTTSEILSKNPYHYAVELLRKAKLEAMADPMIIKRLSRFSFVGGYAVSDARHLGFEDVDFGWGKAVYGGVAKGNIGFVRELLSLYVPCKNDKGENGIVVSIYLPENAMEVFTKELEMLVEKNNDNNPMLA
ncbi:hypothetical protein ABFS82_11G106200 [Erythranthe guttata]|nr:PREDICTED: benzyl alcohol O-benzoyltransferase-like [Erythranthe guttata]|eukprot:XP_012832496.1 PREDICTED: benzyl alcohol O-benzoyltransferase-like [Erythranthe guttata]